MSATTSSNEDQMQTEENTNNATENTEESEEQKREREEQERQLNLIVAKYLQQRGFSKAYEAFQNDAITLGAASAEDFSTDTERDINLDTGSSKTTKNINLISR